MCFRLQPYVPEAATLCAQVVAIKILKRAAIERVRHGTNKGTGYEEMQREICIMKRLSHPNVVQLHEVIDDAERDELYLVMDL